jgi:hypothetical protein
MAEHLAAPVSYDTKHKSLRKEVNQIISMRKKSYSTPEEVRDSHPTFVKEYPKLFEKLMDKNVDMQQLDFIIGMYEKVQKKKTSFDDASKKIGQKMFDQYVKPDLPPPSDMPSPGIQFSTPEPKS